MVMRLERDGRSTTVMMIRSEAFVEAELAYRAGLRGSALHLHEVERAGRRHKNRWFRARRGVLDAPTVSGMSSPSATGATIVDIKPGRRPGAAA